MHEQEEEKEERRWWGGRNGGRGTELSQMHAPGALHNLSTAVLHSFVSPTCPIPLGPLFLLHPLHRRSFSATSSLIWLE